MDCSQTDSSRVCVLTGFFLFFFQVQELGLQSAYTNDPGTHRFLRKMMALPFLPEVDIVPMFTRLERQASTTALQDFTQYVQSTWIESRTWPPSTWSVFMQSVRTNNDLEGWHMGLNRRASGKSDLPFYLLIQLLHREARLTSLQMKLVSERKLKRIQRKKYRALQTRIFDLWEEYTNGERNARQLLSAISHLNGPSQ